MFLFITVYFILFGFAMVESFDNKLLSSFGLVLIFGILFLFAGFRPPFADNDYSTYVGVFENVDKPSAYFTNFLRWGSLEPAYYFLPSILHYWFHLSSVVYPVMLFFAFAGCGIMLYAIRKTSSFPYASALIFFCNYFLLQELTQIRAAVAVGFFLLLIVAKVNRKWTPFLFLFIVSFCFHYSTILALSIFFISHKSINKPLYFSLAILAFVMSFMDFSFLLGLGHFEAGALAAKQDSYLNNIQVDMLNRRNFLFLIYFASSLILILKADLLHVYNRYIYIFIKLQVVGSILYQLFSVSPSVSARVGEYFWVVHIITIPSLIHLFKFKVFPAFAFTILSLAIMLALIYRNSLINVEAYNFSKVLLN